MVETLANNNFDPDENKWDTLNDERSEAEIEYEKNEQYLKNSLFHANDEGKRELSEYGDEIRQIFAKENHEQTEEIDGIMKKMIGGVHGGKQATLEAFCDFVDSKYPSPFVEREEPKNPFKAEDTFKRAMMREGEANEENLKLLAGAFLSDGSIRDQAAAGKLNLFGTAMDTEKKPFADAFIKYVKDGSDEKRRRLTQLRSNQENIIATSLFDIADIFDKSPTNIGKKLSAPALLIAASAIDTSETIFDEMLKYLRFKIENSKR